MINKCKSCDFISSVEVNYEVADDGVVFQISDSCCRYRDCKMIRSIIGKALCVFLEENPEALEVSGSAGPAFSDCCCVIPAFPQMNWTFGLAQGFWKVPVASPASGETGTLSVPSPYFDVV